VPAIRPYNKGNELLKSGNYKEAIEAFNQSIELEPEDNDYFQITTDDARCKIAEAYYLREDYDSALKILNSVLSDRPNFQPGLNLLSQIKKTSYYQETIGKKIKTDTKDYIQKISAVYDYISLNKIMETTAIDLEELQILIEQMILSNQINGKIRNDKLIFQGKRKSEKKEDSRGYFSSNSQERMKKLSKLFKISSRIKIEDLAGLLGLERLKLFNKLIDWSDQFAYEIDGDFLKVNKESLSDFIDTLDKQFVEWEKSEATGQSKI